MENSFERHTEDYCVVILCCNCILSPYALITRFLKRKKRMTTVTLVHAPSDSYNYVGGGTA